MFLCTLKTFLTYSIVVGIVYQKLNTIYVWNRTKDLKKLF